MGSCLNAAQLGFEMARSGFDDRSISKGNINRALSVEWSWLRQGTRVVVARGSRQHFWKRSPALAEQGYQCVADLCHCSRQTWPGVGRGFRRRFQCSIIGGRHPQARLEMVIRYLESADIGRSGCFWDSGAHILPCSTARLREVAWCMDPLVCGVATQNGHLRSTLVELLTHGLQCHRITRERGIERERGISVVAVIRQDHTALACCQCCAHYRWVA